VHLEASAIVCALLPLGETGTVVRFLTPDAGLVAGFVHGGRSRKLRPVLQPGNAVALTLKGRSDTQLATATVELARARSALATTASALATLEWLTTLTATALAEAVPHPPLYDTLDAIIDAIAAGAETPALAEAVVRYELLLLGQLGFGLDLASCAATGSTTDLAYVSPKSSQAVSRGAGLPYADRLLPLPPFLIANIPPDTAALVDGLKLTRYFLERNVLAGHRDIFGPRERLANRVGPRYP
jgi:DNA repair protein RecO (recombination protein O)